VSPAPSPSLWIRLLGAIVGALYLAFGAGELIAHLDEPVSLAFWAPSLLGGGVLVLYGIFGRSRYSTKLVVLGASLGLVATAWTLVIPVLAMVLVVLTFNNAQRGPAAP
jgi:nicotinamide riboside transporter PnuC